MKGQRQAVEWIKLERLIVLTHSLKECLLVAYDIVVPQVILHFASSDVFYRLNIQIFKVFQSVKKTLFTIFFSSHVVFPVLAESFFVISIKDSFLQVLNIFISFLLVFSLTTSLELKKAKIFKLSPNKVCLFNAISESKPVSPHNEPFYHARIVAFSDVSFESMLVLNGRLDVKIV